MTNPALRQQVINIYKGRFGYRQNALFFTIHDIR